MKIEGSEEEKSSYMEGCHIFG